MTSIPAAELDVFGVYYDIFTVQFEPQFEDSFQLLSVVPPVRLVQATTSSVPSAVAASHPESERYGDKQDVVLRGTLLAGGELILQPAGVDR